MQGKHMDVLGTRCRIGQLRPDIIPLDPPEEEHRGALKGECPGLCEIPPGYITVRQAAENHHVSVATIHAWVRAGTIEGLKFGPVWGILE